MKAAVALRTIVLMALLAVSACLHAQKLTFKGKITDEETNEPLAGVNVFVNDSTGTVTDAKGVFSIALPVKPFTVSFSYIGYQPQVRVYSWKSLKGNTLEIAVKLKLSEIALNQVVVTAGRTSKRLSDVSVSMEVIKPRLLQRTNTIRMEDIVNQVPGVNMINTQPSIRGGSGFTYGAGSRVLLLIDGVPLLSGDAADIKWEMIPMESIAQMEVIKGASSALFGSGALGGVMNIRTKRPGDRPFTQVRLFGGWYDDPANANFKYWDQTPWQYGGSVFHSRKIGPLDVTASLFRQQDDGYRRGETRNQIRGNITTRYHHKKIKGLNYGIDASYLNFKGGNFLFWQSAEEPLIPASNTLSEVDNDRISIAPHATYVVNKQTSHKVRSRFYLTDNQNNTGQDAQGQVYFGEYQFQKKLQPLPGYQITFTTGAAYTFNRVVSDSLYGDRKGNNQALFAQADQKLGRVNWSFGMRLERFAIDTINPAYFPIFRSGATVRVGKAGFIRASAGQGIRFPSVAERFTQTNAGGLRIFPNPNVAPETGFNVELGYKQGLKLKSWKGFVDVAAFWTEYQDMVEFIFGFYPPPNFDPANTLQYFGFSAVNVTNARITGIETTLSGVGYIGPLEVEALLGYTYIHPVNRDYEEQPTDTVGNENLLKYRFQHTAKANVDVGYKKFDVGFTVRYNSFMERIDRPLAFFITGLNDYREENDKGFMVADARAGFSPTVRQRVSFIIKNLFNEEYMFFPGSLGAPRTFNMQYQFSF